MEITHLNLCEAGCPLALLIVKRTLLSLGSSQQLWVDVLDVGSQKDIKNYLNAQGYKLEIQKFETMIRFVVT